MEVLATKTHCLGMPIAQFLADYWQKKPLLIRQAFANFEAPLSPEDLAGLACEQGPLSRLIQYQRESNSWQVRSGPFDESEFPTLGDRDWTLLIQDMDKWDADVAEVLKAFAFIPRWRIDDVMISFAATGGSVGAHVDQYDVFLLQAMGERQWQIEDFVREEPAFRADVELKLLQEFTATHTWNLAPGDMLYLPPGFAHHGVALNPCMTFSIGMRAPSHAEMLSDFADYLAQNLPEHQRYQDLDLHVHEDPFLIDANDLTRVKKALQVFQHAEDAEQQHWFGQFITRYRGSGDIAPSPDLLSWEKTLILLAQGHALYRHPFARLAWSQTDSSACLFVSGESYAMPISDAQRLCHASRIDVQVLNQLSAAGQECLANLYQQGFYQFEHN